MSSSKVILKSNKLLSKEFAVELIFTLKSSVQDFVESEVDGFSPSAAFVCLIFVDKSESKHRNNKIMNKSHNDYYFLDIHGEKFDSK